MSASLAPAWVLLRGLTREAGHWGGFRRAFEAVEPRARVLALDLPGAGSRHHETAPADVPRMVQALRETAWREGLQGPLRLFGLSLGGMVAAHWALQAPGQVSHCVVVNSSMRPLSPLHQRLRPSRWPRLLSLLASDDALAVEAQVLRLTSARADELQDVVPAWARLRRLHPVTRMNALRQLLAAARYRLPPAAPAARTLVLCSAGDALVHPDCSRALAAHWRCPCVVHPRAGHDLPLDAPEWVVEQVRGWLRA